MTDADLTTRLFSAFDVDRVDDLGFLDRLLTPRIVQFEDILEEPIAWILGLPWLGKSTVAESVYTRLRLAMDDPAAIPRCELTQLGSATATAAVPPPWWNQWLSTNPPSRAVWLIDGVD